MLSSGQKIAKLGKLHTIAETLILQAGKDMCIIMIGDTASARFGTLSNDNLYKNFRHVL